MKTRHATRSGWVLGFLVLSGAGTARLSAQAATNGAQVGAPAVAAPASAATAGKTTRAGKKRRTAGTAGQLQTIPIEQASPSPAAASNETQAQRVADQKLLQQQQAQSAQAAQVTDQQVKTAQQRIDKVQSEQRIQDAPGPSQTGIVPAAGAPVVPAADGSGTSGGPPIQDAPGPSQTAAPVTQTGTPPTVTTTPPPM